MHPREVAGPRLRKLRRYATNSGYSTPSLERMQQVTPQVVGVAAAKR